MQEKIIRKVTEIGNGAHIFAPKEWLNDSVIIIRIPKKNPKEEILKLIYSHLDKIIAVFLYGSYARNEQEKNSDLDVFIISSEKFQVKAKGIEAVIIPETKLEMAKKLNPILFYSMLQEAKSIINPSYLEKLKKEKPKFEYFKDFVEDTKKSIISSKEIIYLDDKLKNKFASESVIYSLILRLRGIFIINSLFKKRAYSKNLFKNWLLKNSNIDYNKVYKIYTSIRDNKKSDEKISIEQAKTLLSLLAKKTEKLSLKLKI